MPRKFEDLVTIMNRLRDPGGCPWDREQTFETLRGYLLEECYEVAETLDRSDWVGLREELGDLLFQIVFLSRLAQEQGHFSVSDVVLGIAEKMIRRHPHVFGEARAETSEEVLRRWEEIKREEKGTEDPREESPSVLEGIPRALPALLKAHRLGTKAARVGFDWEKISDVFAKVEEELAELRRAVEREDLAATREELGDLLFVIAMVGRRLGVDPEGALEAANWKFQERFRAIEARLRRDGLPIEEAGLTTLDRLWNEVKEASRKDPDRA